MMSGNTNGKRQQVSPIYGVISVVFGIFMIRIALAYTITTVSYVLIFFGLFTIIIGIGILVSYNKKEGQ
tara:strand:+ start:239 stop:445 length:207 start_codon:yes stop_codon:yes gene_type:complete